MRVRECEEVSEGEETTCADGRLQVYFSVNFGPWRFFGDALPEQGGVHLGLISGIEDGSQLKVKVA